MRLIIVILLGIRNGVLQQLLNLYMINEVKILGS